MAAFEPPEKPIGIIEAITSGFEFVSGNPGLIAFPVLLDVFLWLGPHLSIKPLLDGSIDLLLRAAAGDPAFQQSLEALVREAGEVYNAFALLSTAPLGVPSLMSGFLPGETPLGTPGVWPVANGAVYLAAFVGLSLLGLLLGAMYMGVIARGVAGPENEGNVHLFRLPVYWGRFIGLALLGLVLWLALIIPMAIVVGVLSAIASFLGVVGTVIALMMSLWLVFYLSFAPHGMLLRDRSLLNAVWDSVRLVQWNLTATMLLYSLCFAIYVGLNYIWSLPESNSWWVLVGIGGHAFIVTSLVAASFLFYKDRYRWWVENRDWIHTQLAERRRRANFALRSNQQDDVPQKQRDEDEDVPFQD